MTGPNTPIGEDDLQAHIDGRVGVERLPMVEAHLAEQPEVQSRLRQERLHQEAMRRALQQKYEEPIPARLRLANIRADRRHRFAARTRAGVVAAGIFLIGCSSGWVAAQRWSSATPSLSVASASAVSGEALAAYRTFVVEVAHPVEVGADKEQHLTAWLSKRLGRRITAPDLSAFGFTLMGGRLLSGDTGAAAQMMYETKDGDRLTLYVKAADGGETAFRFFQSGSAATLAWLDQGYGFAVTASLPRAALLPIAETVYRDLDSERSGEARQPG